MEADTAAEFVAKFRYSEDISVKKNTVSKSQKYEILEVHSSLLITKTISPLIYSALERVCVNLHILPEKIHLYVFASNEINAKCYRGVEDVFVVILSSALVTLLEERELDFVIGHELGHLLFDQTSEIQDSSPEGMRLSRAKELSVDRLGLVASRDLDITLRAIIKTISGLNSKYINFNIAEFMDQLRHFDLDASDILSQSTHPSFLIRARALMLFSSSDVYQDLFQEPGKDITKIDVMIKREMDKYIDKSYNEQTSKLKDNFNFWLTCFAVVSHQSLTKDAQDYISKTYGNQRLQKFKSLVKGRSSENIQEIINKKLLQASEDLASYRSISMNQDIESTVTYLSERFNIDNLDKMIIKFYKSDNF